MKSQVNDLVSMRDVESLAEILAESEDWMDQMDAAEGLMQLGDRRGLEHLLIARESEIDEIRQVAREILADPETKRLREQIDAALHYGHQKLVEAARIRLQKGKKVFLHKVVYISPGELSQEDENGKGIHLLELDDAGLEGWEVVSVLPRRNVITGEGRESTPVVYAFLKRQLDPDEAADLEPEKLM
jgi:hypothetical protein